MRRPCAKLVGRRLGGRSDQGQCGTGEHISRRFQVVVQIDQEPAVRVKQKNPGNPHLEFLDELEARAHSRAIVRPGPSARTLLGLADRRTVAPST